MMRCRAGFPFILSLLLSTLLLLPAVPAGAAATTEDAVPAPVPPPDIHGPTLFFEDFDSYADGSDMHGQGGWKGWGNNPAAGALVTSDQAHSAPHSVDINGPSDLVHEFSGFTAGQWVFTAWAYVPANAVTGPSFFILLNTYADGGPNNWSVQVQLDNTSGQVVSDFDGGSLPLITDQWVEMRVEIDLDADVQTFYYDGQMLYTKSWAEGVTGGGVANIGAVDLFANNSTSVYYDDISLCSAAGCATDLSISKTNSAGEGAEVELGSAVDYSITVTNNGPSDTTGVEVTDDLPAEVGYVADDCGGVNGPPWTWAIGDLAIDDSVTCNITVSADVVGTAVNTATVASDLADDDSDNDASTSTFEIVEEAAPVVEIPTLGTLGFAALALLLAAGAFALMRRRRSV